MFELDTNFGHLNCFSSGRDTCAIENLGFNKFNGKVMSTKLFPTIHVLHEVNIRKYVNTTFAILLFYSIKAARSPDIASYVPTYCTTKPIDSPCQPINPSAITNVKCRESRQKCT